MHVRGHSGDTRDALCCAPLVVVSLSEERKKGRKECLCVLCTVVTRCVCLLVDTVFLRKVNTACHVAAADAAPPFPKGAAHSDPVRTPLPEHEHQGIQSAALTLGVVFDRTAECCVRHSRASTAALSRRGSTSQPLYRDSAQLAGIGRYCRCLPVPSLVFARYCRESQGSSRYCRSLES